MRVAYIAALLAGVLSLGSGFAESTPTARQPTVKINGHDLVIVASDGHTRVITRADAVGVPALSPDSRMIGYIKRLGPGEESIDPDLTAVVLVEVGTLATRTFMRPGTNLPHINGVEYESNVTFSEDGRWLYVEAYGFGDTDFIYKVRTTTGEIQYFRDGVDISVIRDGPWRGFILLGRHAGRKAGGSDYPVSVLRPDGTKVMIVPGTYGPHPDEAVGRWLKLHKWRAW